ncbi:MAG: tryptophan 7-halogenase [Phaeodactylibacter sp.]|nr:tryptophan 7-halogenase [Phaeodactylibacter sp.]MCB9274883.1 tryptophan 7-halogenase [Lewinellaceae bacterium]
MKEVYDVIIIGGGPTGSTLATFLSRAGHRVLVLEKEKFPREHIGESMLPFCYDIFEELGVLDGMKANFTRKPGVTFANIDGSRSSHWCFSRVINGPQSLSFHARRSEFDELLLNNSRKAGAEVREEMQVTKVELGQPGDNAMVYVQSRQGEALTFEGRFLLDASGQDCFMPRMLRNQKPFSRLNIRLALSSHWKNARLDETLSNGNIRIVHIGGEKLGWIWMIPLKDDRLSVGLALNMNYAQEQRKILSKEHGAREWQQALYLQELNTSPLVMSILGEAEMYWDVVSNGDYSYYAEQKYGHNFAIVGDSAAFLDPIFSSGIYLGMVAAKMVAEGVDKILRGNDYSAVEKAYADMDGGYKVIEELICTFYEPNSIALSDLQDNGNFSYDKFESAYSILHLLLAGDFFKEPERYLRAINTLRSQEMIDKYKSLTGHLDAKMEQKVCLMPEMQ